MTRSRTTLARGKSSAKSALQQAGATSVSAETIGSSQWKLELRDWQYEPPFFEALSDLSKRSGAVNLFYEPEFLNASHLRIGPPGRKMLVLWEILDGKSEAKLAFPLNETRVGFPAHRVWSAENTPYSPLGMPLIDEADFEESVHRFAGLYTQLPELRDTPLLFDDFPCRRAAGSGFIQLLSSSGLFTTRAADAERACLTAADGAIKVSSKQRQELRRQLRKLGEFGSVTFEDARDFWDVMARFEEFLVLETRGWKGRKGTSIHILRKTASFARQTVAALADRKRATIHTLRLDGKAIASLIVLRSGDSYFPWKTAFDEACRRFSPGKHLMLHTTEWMQSRPHFEMADSLARETSWMDRLWSEQLDLCSLVVSSAENRRLAEKLASSIDRKTGAKAIVKRLLKR